MDQLTRIANNRDQLLASYPSLIERVKSAREKTVQDLRGMTKRAKENLEGKRAKVYYAKTALEGQMILAELLAGQKEIVRTSNSTLRELALDGFLQSKGIAVSKTDVAEIIFTELASKESGHPLLQGLGLTKEQASTGLQQYLDNTLVKEPQDLNSLTREKIKSSIVKSTFGITGANTIVAENGTVIIAEDEGNGRAVSNLTYHHIAVVGIEQVTDTAEESMDILQGTSILGLGKDQHTYFSLISGPSRTADIELKMAYGMHGPKETHIILLDNGRTQLVEQGYGEILQCIECGACFETCQKLALDNQLPKGIILTPKNIALRIRSGDITGLTNISALSDFKCPLGIDILTVSKSFK